MNINEISASNSQAVLISELTDQRRDLRELIAACKKVMAVVPDKERRELLSVVMEIERKLK